MDANFCIFPLVVALVEKEKKRSWASFLNNLKAYIEIKYERESLVLITDRQK